MVGTTAPVVASPVDFETYGDYAPPPNAYRREGNLASLVYPIDDRLSDDGATGFTAEPGRYHLYVSLYCPWAQRPLTALKLRGLEGVVTWSSVDPVRDGRGWAFRDGRGYTPDPVNGFTLLREAYLATDPDFDGHVSVPALWDRRTGRLVSNHYPTMTADLETCFAAWADPGVHLYDRTERAEIDALDEEIVRDLAGGTYAASGARSQSDYDAVSARVFGALDRFDTRLASRRFLLGDHVTDADLLLYVNLVRFDVVAGPLGRLNLHRLVDYPNLWPYARDLYQRRAFRDATDFGHIKTGTFRTGAGARTSRIVPAGPVADWDAPHDRDRFG
ncbi:MAG TPA: glutathione S-transferase C-terminal domain-containing protein [Acidimicrobiia bacterium]|nr:glutathione S-transferase C-terminal domain-containing protein [Acidimicrobiia bacterium]